MAFRCHYFCQTMNAILYVQGFNVIGFSLAIVISKVSVVFFSILWYDMSFAGMPLYQLNCRIALLQAIPERLIGLECGMLDLRVEACLR